MSQKKNNTEETASLLCGLARWRIAIHSGEDLTREGTPEAKALSAGDKIGWGALDVKKLANFYICIDADILNMYANPSSGAGYLGLRYYGSADKVHPDDFAAAAFLSGALGRFILFALECKQKSTDSRLLLPAHAEEVQRRFDKARRRANSEIDKATQEWLYLKDSAMALANATQSDKAAGTVDLAKRLQNFISHWFGEVGWESFSKDTSKQSSGASGLQAVEEAERYAELFANSKRRFGKDEPCEERVLHITRYRFGQPINGFPPEASVEKIFQKHLDSWSHKLWVGSKAIERIRQEVEQGLDDMTKGFNQRELNHATDAYAMAWVDSLDDIIKETATNGDIFNLKLISGAEILKKKAVERVITPMQLVKLFIQSRTNGKDAERAINTLKFALDNLLESVHVLINEEDAGKDYLSWCQELCELDHAKEKAQGLNPEVFEPERLKDVLYAWSEMTNLLAAQEQAGRPSGGQSLFARVQALLKKPGAKDHIDIEQWIKAIDHSLHDAEKKLGSRSTALSIQALHTIPPKTPRNPPPLRFNSLNKFQKTLGIKMLWSVAKERDWKNLISILESSKDFDRDPLISILGGLAWCIFGRWHTARRSFYLAFSTANNIAKPYHEKAIVIEAAYAHAVARRITASKPEDINDAETYLDKAKEYTAQSFKQFDIRFITEEYSLKTIHLWAKTRTTIDYPIQEDATKQLLLALKIYETWGELIQHEEERYIIEYTKQELMCDILQLYWLGKYGIYGRQLLQLPEINDCDVLLSRVKSVAKALLQQCEYLTESHDDDLPSVTSLVQVNAILARLSILEDNPDVQEVEETKQICEDPRYWIIPIVDKTRYLFFTLFLKQEERRINDECFK